MTAGTISFSRGEDPLRADKLNAAFVERVLLKGDTMAGPLILSRDPVLPFEASTKQYIDALVTAHLTNFLSTTGGTLTGFLTLHADPVNPMHAVTKHYVDLALGAGGFISDAPNDGKAYGRASALWTPVLPITGGTLTGALTVNAQIVTIGADTQTSPALIINGGATTGKQILFRTASKNRWVMLGDGTGEGGSNTGTNFALYRYADDGTTLLATALNISRATGLTTINGRLLVNGSADNGSSGLQVAGGIASNSTITGIGVIAGFNGTSYPALVVNGASGSDRQVTYQTNGVIRWLLAASSIAESGGNAGSDYTINRYNDAGTYLGTPLNINRATGAVGIAQTLNVAGAVSANGTITAANGRIISQGTANTSVCVYDTTQNYAAGMFLGAGRTLYFGNMDSSGNYSGTAFGSFDAIGNFTALGLVRSTTDMTCGTTVYINYPTVSDFYLTRGGGNRFFQWATGWFNQWRESDGLRVWVGNNTNCMTLDGAGNLIVTNNVTSVQWICKSDSTFVLTPTSGRLLQFAGGTYVQYATNLYINANSTGGQNIALVSAGALTFNQVGAFKPGGGPWTDSSDARIKRVTGDYKSGLAEILKLEPRRAIYLGNDVHVTRENLAAHAEARDGSPDLAPLQSHHAQAAEREQEFIGFVAQEIEEAMPELVSHIHGTIDDEFVEDLRVVDTQPLLYAMVNAFKELDARLQQLENRG